MTEAPRSLESYLEDLRARLSGLAPEDVQEIVLELKSHVRDSTPPLAPPGGPEVAAILDRLGSPAALAELYLADRSVLRTSRSRSPWLLMRALARAAGLSVAGALAFFGLLVGYTLSLSFALAAVVKPFAPASAGLFRPDPDTLSLNLGFGAPPAGEELLGPWIVPIGLAAGALGFWLTTRFARACLRRLRRPPLAARSAAR